VHVIQTFVSELLSEETQIKGRTARQGNQGSYSMVLLDIALEKFDISSTDIATMSSKGEFYTTLDHKRTAYFEKQYAENNRSLDDIKKEHDDSRAFTDDLVNQRTAKIEAFLRERNRAQVGDDASGTSRTLVLMDATVRARRPRCLSALGVIHSLCWRPNVQYSMSSLLDKTKNTVAIMFERAYTILQEKKDVTGEYFLQQ
jgi:hypothetical protein